MKNTFATNCGGEAVPLDMVDGIKDVDTCQIVCEGVENCEFVEYDSSKSLCKTYNTKGCGTIVATKSPPISDCLDLTLTMPRSGV